MKIHRMTATFGGLEQAVLTPGEGLTVVEAPNEAGKSTWCAFLRAMLYGIPTKERDKQGYLAEKNRFRPWNGGALAGALELTWQGEEITLLRSARGSNPFGAFQAIYTATGQPVPGLTGENCGECLLGVPREVFERSALIGQDSLPVEGVPTLDSRIAALVSSGEEDVSFRNVERQLKEWRNRRRYNQTGLIPRMELELREAAALSARQADARRRAEDAAVRMDALEVERTRLTEERQAYRTAEEATQRARYEAALADCARAEQEERRLRMEIGAIPSREELREGQGQLAHLRSVEAGIRQAEQAVVQAGEAQAAAHAEVEADFFSSQPADAVWEQAVLDDAQLRRKRHTPLPIAILFFALLAAGLIVHRFFFPALPELAVAALVCGGLGIVLFIGSLALRARGKAQRRALLARYGVEDAQALLPRVGAYREKAVKAAAADRAGEAAAAALAQLTEERLALRASLLAMVHTFAPEVKEMFGVSAAISKALNLGEKQSNAATALSGAQRLLASLPIPKGEVEACHATEPRYSQEETERRLAETERALSALAATRAMAQGELNSTGDAAQLQAQIEALTSRLSIRQEELDALTLALTALEEADRELQTRFSPELNRRAGRWMERLTGGRYDTVSLRRDFAAFAKERDTVLPRESIALSRGTSDQLYLAVRLALCELILPEESAVPLVLDDALAFFDDARMALALQALAELGKTRQVILFTCHGREGAWVRNTPESGASCLQLPLQ